MNALRPHDYVPGELFDRGVSLVPLCAVCGWSRGANIHPKAELDERQESEMSLVDSGLVRLWALGTIAEWLPGYTDTLEDGHQRRITDVSDADGQGPLTVSIEKAGLGHGVQKPDVFVVDVTVMRVHDYHEWPAVGACSICGQLQDAAVHR